MVQYLMISNNSLFCFKSRVLKWINFIYFNKRFSCLQFGFQRGKGTEIGGRTLNYPKHSQKIIGSGAKKTFALSPKKGCRFFIFNIVISENKEGEFAAIS